jgi:hypothetical protein
VCVRRDAHLLVAVSPGTVGCWCVCGLTLTCLLRSCRARWVVGMCVEWRPPACCGLAGHGGLLACVWIEAHLLVCALLTGFCCCRAAAVFVSRLSSHRAFSPCLYQHPAQGYKLGSAEGGRLSGQHTGRHKVSTQVFKARGVVSVCLK